MPTQYATGVIHGRFQVLHNDHLRYLMAGKKLCGHLVIGITNPDPTLIREEKDDQRRSSESANPLTYYERYCLVRDVLLSAGVTRDQMTIVPFPISFPKLYRFYVPMDAVFFLSIYDDWGRRKRDYFHRLGLETHVLWEVKPENKGISGADVRSRMAKGEPWEHLVPDTAAKLLKQWKLEERLRHLNEVNLY
jgi:nicotinamide-nucleotide adenylyltransferase